MVIQSFNRKTPSVSPPFNKKGERFDADGKYIRKWVPELKNILGNEVHNPDRKLRLEASYPEAMVDHHEAIAIYKSKYSG